MSLTHLSIIEARKGLDQRDFSSQELTASYVNALEAGQDLNAYITVTADLAMNQAQASDQRLAQGGGGLLEGIPLGIKDLFCTKGVETTAGSRILKGFVPPYESEVTRRLWVAGAVLLGKTNLDEFAMGSSNVTSFFGPVKNPWKNISHPNQALVPGGSSGGSAASVAAGLAAGALGTDTGGSIRQPAALCGIVGLKPTYGRCSRWGIVAFSSSLDQAGPLTRTVADAALLMSVIAGHDPADSTSSTVSVPDYTQVRGNGQGLKVGIPEEYRVDGMNPELLALWEQGYRWLQDAGAEIIPVSLPHTQYALPTYHVLAPAEASSNLARYDGVRFGQRELGESIDEMYSLTRKIGFGDEVKRRILMGTYMLSQGHYESFYMRALDMKARIYHDFERVFEQVDLLLTPSVPNEAFAIGENTEDPVTMYLQDVLTVPVNLAGLPAISVPSGLSKNGLPLGLQLIGRRFDEETLLRGAYLLEEAACFPALPFFEVATS